jgi:hypothetical protein
MVATLFLWVKDLNMQLITYAGQIQAFILNVHFRMSLYEKAPCKNKGRRSISLVHPLRELKEVVKVKLYNFLTYRSLPLNF